MPPPPQAHRPPPSGPRPPAPQDRRRPRADSEAGAPKPARPQPPSNRAVLIAAGLTGLLALGVLATLVLRGAVGGSAPVELDVVAAQDGVRQVLTDPINGYGRDKVSDVRCNNGVNPTVRKGTSFSCVVTVDGAQRRVLAEFTDDAGTYAVDRPR
ncbi:DUF4333 domain-containing protein [Mycobacterium sp. UM_Kg27]|uniref:DUF4333 domain-containing protein n=2 Tax=unclassified Mycobacterium TaxID=2642494 RepID=UPI001EF9D885|nr:DUF4333 domain-containing protein [Mycobacterium sp. UM_Kg27]